MRISQKSEYALSAVLDLSLHSPEDLVKVAGIASRQRIPARFLEIILADLKHRGYVTARRGSKGGYRLARSADQITVGDVLACFGERKLRKARGGLSELWTRVERSVWGILDETTFADLIQRPGDHPASQEEVRRPFLPQLTVKVADSLPSES
jgi:Rrf2 family transcriptional regulator, cysteine metabolism repressor